MIQNCEWCKKEYINPRSRRRTRFCSNSCSLRKKWADGKFKVNEGLGWINSQGYRYLIRGGKEIAEHRFVMENFLGRKLESKEHIHHKNGIRNDNRLENLEVLTERQHHRSHSHISERTMKLIIRRVKRGLSHRKAVVGTNASNPIITYWKKIGLFTL